MKMTKINRLLFGLLVLTSAREFAQTVNTGDLYISPGVIVSSVGRLDNTSTGDLVNDGDLLLYNDYNNNGLVTFTPGVSTGMTRFVGSGGSQVISGSKLMDWDNVVFHNDKTLEAFHLKTEVRIYGDVFFERGIMEIDAGSGTIVFEDDARHFNASNLSYMHGEVHNVGDDFFEFPVGVNGYYRGAGMSAPSHKTDVFAARYILENSDLLYSHTKKAKEIIAIDKREYWTVSRIESVSDVMLSLSWDEQTTDVVILEAPHDEISIVRWDVDQNMWLDQEGVVESGSKMVTVVLDPLQSHGVFALARLKVDKEKDDDIIVYNAVSPNGDGRNDYLRIDGLQRFSTNKVKVYNRYGAKVYETVSYNTAGNVFKGIAEGKGIVVKRNEKLPDGTYFYTIRASHANGEDFKKAGYLYIKK